jgi:hypothetical protein
MTQDEIIEMARQAGFEIENGMFDAKVVCVDGVSITRDLEAFAKLVAAKEREACAKVCEEEAIGAFDNNDVEYEWCAKLIRERGES